MKMRKIDVTRLKIDQVINKGIEFHGHLGPFLVAGIKMGHLALRELDSKGHSELSALVQTGTKPPISCLIDGIQVSTGCTLGKGNVKVIDNKKARASFSKDEKSIEIELKADVLKMISEEKSNCEEMAKKIIDIPEEQLFQWK